MPYVLAQAPVQFASTAVAAGQSKQYVTINTAGTTAGLTSGTGNYFLLNLPAAGIVPDKPFKVVAQGRYNVVTTTTAAIGLSWAAYSATAPSLADAFTAVASASLTGSTAPGTPYAWQIQQQFVADAMSSTTNGSGILSAFLPANYFVGAAAVTPVTIGTQLTSVNYGSASIPPNVSGSASTGYPATQPLYSISFAIQFTNGSSNTTADSTFVVESFYAVEA